MNTLSENEDPCTQAPQSVGVRFTVSPLGDRACRTPSSFAYLVISRV